MKYVRNCTDSWVLGFRDSSIDKGIIYKVELGLTLTLGVEHCYAVHGIHCVRDTFVLPPWHPCLFPPGPRVCIPSLLSWGSILSPSLPQKQPSPPSHCRSEEGESTHASGWDSRQRTSPRACANTCRGSQSQVGWADCSAPSAKRYWLLRGGMWKIMKRLRTKLFQIKLWARCCDLHSPWMAM